MKKYILGLILIATLAQGSFFADNNVIEGVSTIVSSAGSSTLLYNNNKNIIITGSTTHTLKLPTGTSMRVGNSFSIKNQSTGTVTVQYNDGSTAATLTSGVFATFLLTDKSTSNGTWSIKQPLAGASAAAIVDGDIANNAGIVRSKLAAQTAYRILANNSTGYMSENAALSASAVLFGDVNGQITSDSNNLFYLSEYNRLGVGTNAAGSSVVVNGTSRGATITSDESADANALGISIHRHGGTASLGAQESKIRSRGTTTVPTIVQNGDVIGQEIFLGFDGVDYEQTASIQSLSDGTPGSNDMPGRLQFNVTADGGVTPTEALRISSTTEITAASAVTATGAIQSNTAVLLQDPGAGTNTIKLQSPASLASSYVITLPPDNGAPNEFLTNNGSGVLDWADAATAASVVTTGYSGVRQASATISNTGTPTVNFMDGAWITSLTDHNTGETTINIAASTFGEGPRCVCTSYGGGLCTAFSKTVTTFRILTTTLAGAGSDKAFEVICFGTK